MSILVDLDRVAVLTRDVAAQVHIPPFGSGVQREAKSPGELVSRVDREAEALLIEGLRNLTPDIPVVGVDDPTGGRDLDEGGVLQQPAQEDVREAVDLSPLDQHMYVGGDVDLRSSTMLGEQG